ncbi:F0F1 ATP synthase subunit delta [Nocardioides ferulae]|uniref:F0F1 ATP synthase subunit delta n=1 Tax=Nocardioides ferulae TaxID=2340821 RepID=UPI000EAC55FE|nr:F0F1 ATP synthase subunit delta [Nocardioides ferulae]
MTLPSNLRGASAEAATGLTEQLNQAAGSTDLARVGKDLFAVAEILRSEPALRRSATDPGKDRQARAGLMRGLLEGKVNPVSLQLVGEAVASRWTLARDLADALEHLGVVATVRSAGDADARRLSDELFAVGRLVNDESELRNALSDRSRSVADKRRLLSSLLGDRVLPATLALAEQALAGSYRTVGVAIEEYQKVAASVHQESVAEVRVAAALSASDQERLQRTLSAQYGRPVHLNVVVDPELVGGLRIAIGDDVIDGTVSSRLDEARRALAG